MSLVMKHLIFSLPTSHAPQSINQIAYVTFRRKKINESANSAFHPFSFQAALLLIFPYFDPVFPFQNSTHHFLTENYCAAKKCAQQSHFHLSISFVIFSSKTMQRDLNLHFYLTRTSAHFYSHFICYEIFI